MTALEPTSSTKPGDATGPPTSRSMRVPRRSAPFLRTIGYRGALPRFPAVSGQTRPSGGPAVGLFLYMVAVSIVLASARLALAEVPDLILDGRDECLSLHESRIGTPGKPVRVIMRNCGAVKIQQCKVHGGIVIEPTSSIVLQRCDIDGHDEVDTCLDFSESSVNKIQNNR